jgi:hypothetical protein
VAVRAEDFRTRRGNFQDSTQYNLPSPRFDAISPPPSQCHFLIVNSHPCPLHPSNPQSQYGHPRRLLSELRPFTSPPMPRAVLPTPRTSQSTSATSPIPPTRPNITATWVSPPSPNSVPAAFSSLQEVIAPIPPPPARVPERG